jgi:hypothetical protein
MSPPSLLSDNPGIWLSTIRVDGQLRRCDGGRGTDTAAATPLIRFTNLTGELRNVGLVRAKSQDVIRWPSALARAANSLEGNYPGNFPSNFSGGQSE